MAMVALFSTEYHWLNRLLCCCAAVLCLLRSEETAIMSPFFLELTKICNCLHNLIKNSEDIADLRVVNALLSRHKRPHTQS